MNNLQTTLTNSYISLSSANAKFAGPMAMFDLDCTLIKPKNGKTPKKPYTEYVYMFPNVISTLIILSKKYQIVIISNQKVLKTDEDKNAWIEKIKKFQQELNIELIVLGALCDDRYRKPRLGFLELIIPDVNRSFFCGDALGRCGIINDFSDCDLKFALNLGVPCNSPEFIFKNILTLFNEDLLNIRVNYPKLYELNYYKTFRYRNSTQRKEVIIMVGITASGKSLISRWIQLQNSFQIYNIISRDKEKTMKKCLIKMEESLKNGCNVIIDNTNPSIESRKPWIEMANKYGFTAVIINITSPGDDFRISLHNNYYRNQKFDIPLIPVIALYKYLKDFQKPSLDEGCDEIFELDYMLPTYDEGYFKYLAED